MSLTKLLFLGAALAISMPSLAQTLVYCSEGSPEALNPQRTLSGTARNATATTLYDRLVDFEPGTTRIVPSLAQSWTLSEDRKVYEFQLRHGVKFQQTEYFTPTRELNADDVLFSFNRQLDPDHPYYRVGGGNYQYFQGMGMDKLIARVEKLDDYRLRIVLNQPEAPFLADLAMPFMSILSAEYGQQLMKQNTPEKIDHLPVGTGPYRFRSYQKDSLLRFAAHPGYWGSPAKVENLVFAITPDPSVRLQKLRTGECQIAVSPAPADLMSIRRDRQLVLDETEGMNIGYLAMNMEKPPFNDVRVRRAIAHALNKQRYIDAVYQGTAEVAINPYPANLWSYTDKVVTYGYDPQAARKLLSEAGYPSGFKTTLWTLPVSRPYNPNGRKMGEMMQADLAKVGIQVELATFDWGTYLDKVKRGEHQLVQLGWSGDNGDPDNFLYTLLSCAAVTRGSNNSRYCSKPFDQLISQARIEPDQAVRSGLYQQALGQLSQDVPLIPIAHSKVFRVLSPRVVGYAMNPFDMDYFSSLSLRDR
ncbi:ABC transporter substrate-binding protein [Enterobacterales bacterium AE_CKDN230030158-1A_HGKHYDSX7]